MKYVLHDTASGSAIFVTQENMTTTVIDKALQFDSREEAEFWLNKQSTDVVLSLEEAQMLVHLEAL